MQVKLKLLKKVMSQLREGWLFVEGKRDKEAFLKLGFYDILTISGNLRISCDKVCESVPEQKVFVLTDFDRRGNELAKMAKEELQTKLFILQQTMRRITISLMPRWPQTEKAIF